MNRKAKILPALELVWLAEALSALSGLCFLSENWYARNAGNLLCVTVYVLLTLALRLMWDAAAGFRRAFYGICTALVMAFLSAVCTSLAAQSGPLAMFTVLCSLVGNVFSLWGSFWLYWTLDKRVLFCRYLYRWRRIRGCFYFPFLGWLTGFLLQIVGLPTWPGTLVQIAAQGIVLYLLVPYMIAVRIQENAQ